MVGAGAGGLAAAIDLARRGVAVTVVERSEVVGGKMRVERIGDTAIDAGPTVFTMKWVFDELFAAAGASVEDYLTLRKEDLLARHAWRGGAQLDLFADVNRSAAAIAAFAGGKNADGYVRFAERSEMIYNTLRDAFMKGRKPSRLDVLQRVGFLSMPSFLAKIDPMRSLWEALGRYFDDPRLIQLFGRYATYVGSSPFDTPATIMLVAHAERTGVWSVEGGMGAVATAMRRLGESLGVEFAFNSTVEDIIVNGQRVAGVRLANSKALKADIVIFNGDRSALAEGLLGKSVGRGLQPTPRVRRSLSAVTACMHARPSGFQLAFHNVFFNDFYKDEFDAIFRSRRLPQHPTVYLCAQDRAASASGGAENSASPERLFLLMNAPPDGDISTVDAAMAFERAIDLLSACGLSIDDTTTAPVFATPSEFNGRFPATGGALYGRTCHGMTGALDRPGATTHIRGLLVAGGSVHPGPGVPMAAMSGRLAAAQAMEGFQSAS
ncbi:MAG: phytoene desaturase [Alphaproteobacteria bacterium]|nr:phytoene desaturase [Alphaproteobacteria bacterium]